MALESSSSSSSSMTATTALTDEQKLEICKRLLLSSPPGQFDFILADLQTIMAPSSSSLLTDEWIKSTREAYQQATGSSIITLQQNQKQEEAASSSSSLSLLARDIKELLRKEKFENDDNEDPSAAAAAVSVTEPSPSLIQITTFVSKVDQKNGHAGYCHGKYQVHLVPGGSRAGSSSSSLSSLINTMSGKMELSVHCLEKEEDSHTRCSNKSSSNVTLASCKQFDNTSLRQSSAKGVVQQIQKWETEMLEEQLGPMFDTTLGPTLKALRRVMPVTRTRMDWNVQPHRIASTLGKNNSNIKPV